MFICIYIYILLNEISLYARNFIIFQYKYTDYYYKLLAGNIYNETSETISETSN